MSSSVLFDVPGPRTRARHRLYSVITLVLIVAFIVWAVKRLYDNGQFEDRILERLVAGNVWNAILEGLTATLIAAAISIVTSVVVGFLLAVARLSDHGWVRWPATVFVEFFRAVPLLLMIFLFFKAYQRNLGLDGDVAALTGLVTGLTLYNGSVLCEVFRAGINAVPKGQKEAAYALGMRKTQVMMLVLAPQSIKFILPAIISQCVVVLKDTSLGFIITYDELLRQAKNIATYVGSSFMTYAMVAVLYIAINSLLALAATWAERRFSRTRGGSATKIEQVEEVLPAG